MPTDAFGLLAADVVELEEAARQLHDENRILRDMLSVTLEITHQLIVSLYARFQ